MWNIEKDPILRSTILAVAIFDRPPDWERLRRAHRPRRPASSRGCASGCCRRRSASARRAGRPSRRSISTSTCAACGSPAPGNERALLDALQPIATDELRPRPPAVGVHALRRARRRRRRARRVRDEGAPLGHRRRRRHGAARPARRPRPRRRPKPTTTTCPRAPAPEHVGTRRRRCATRSRTPPRAMLGIARRIPGDASRDATVDAMRDPLGTRREAIAHRALGRPHARARDGSDVAGHASTAGSAAGSRRSTSRSTTCSRVGQGDRGQPQRRVRRRGRRRRPPLPRAPRRGADRAAHDAADQPAPRRRRRGRQPLRARPLPRAGRDRRSARAHRRDPARSCASWRAEPALQMTSTLAGMLNRLPTATTTALFGGMLKCCDFVTTNVPGAPVPVYVGRRPRRAAVRVRAARGRRVQRRADLALRHVLHRRRDRHHRGARRRRAARLPARRIRRGPARWPDP